MPDPIANEGSLPIQGARCLAAPNGEYWAPGAIQRVNEDGTYTVEFDEKQMEFMPYWYGVTSDEISVNDETLWPKVFPSVASHSAGMSSLDFAKVLSKLGYQLHEGELDTFWAEQCKVAFGLEDAGCWLNQEQAYQLLRRAGCCARQIVLADLDREVYFKLYWNLIRMGGRQPGEISRAVTLDDAFRAIGLRQPSVHAASRARVEKLQRKTGVELPAELRRLLCCKGIADAVLHSHPNNPQLVFPRDNPQDFLHNPPLPEGSADFALTILEPHQGDHIWSAVFNRDDRDARVYVTWDSETWKLTAPNLGLFFWDLAQTGLIWYQNTGFQGGKPLENTDIGVAPRH